MTDLNLDDKTLQTLTPYGFDATQLQAFAERVNDLAGNAVKGTLTLTEPEDITTLPALGTPERARLRTLGLDLLKAGKAGAVILAGGMATRFGGVVKAVVPVLGDKSFLEIKLLDLLALEQATGRPVPTFIMSSFATHDRILEHLKELAAKGLATTHVHVFPQLVSLRLTPSGGLFKDAEGKVSPYATGHGDLTFALRKSGLLQRFMEQGGTTLLMSNVDNLGATLDPALLALHHGAQAAITGEVVRKAKGDKGGAPARLDGKPQIIEGFRFPEGFDDDQIPVFNTNTFFLDAKAMDKDFPLPFYRVEKKVGDQTAIQFERLVGEVTAFVPTRFVEVEREGPDGRFLPAKDPAELTRRLPDIATVAASRRSLAD